MGIFDSGVDRAEFERFRDDVLARVSGLDDALRKRVSDLQDQINLKATDSEAQAKAAADSAMAIEGKIRGTESRVEEILETLEKCKESADAELLSTREKREQSEKNSGDIADLVALLSEEYKKFTAEKDAVCSAISEIYEELEEVKKIVATGAQLTEQVENISDLSTKAGEIYSNVGGLLDGAMKRKAALDDLHRKVFGYKVEGEEGESQEVEGLKHELESAYDDVKSKVESLESELSELSGKVLADYSSQLDEQRNEFAGIVSNSRKRIDEVDGELKALLPGSLAAGLSAAFEGKKDDEVKAQREYASSFKSAIFAMIAISLIPFGVDAYLLLGKEYDIIQVVKDTPNLIVSILPLYFPVLWFAYSANKKLNLSKRLIEEYTHKAVLGKTFSGLSNQIESLPHEVAVKEELRTKLLFNILQVSSENPGKLITDYNRTDHPIMEALENSAKLRDSVEAISKLPGLSALADKLASKAKNIIEEQSLKVEQGLAIQATLEPKESLGSGEKP
ncbi:hypothetical protein D9M70_415640 [compost metagenome]